MLAYWYLVPSASPSASCMREKRNGPNVRASAYTASSRCIASDAAAMSVPAGMNVPSESVMSLRILRWRETAETGGERPCGL